MVGSVMAGEIHKVFDRKQQTRRDAIPNPFITAECMGVLQNNIWRWAGCLTAVSAASLAKSSQVSGSKPRV